MLIQDVMKNEIKAAIKSSEVNKRTFFVVPEITKVTKENLEEM